MAQGFIFGGNTPWTYDQLQRKREIADALAAQIGAPRDVGEGLSAIGKALAARGINRRADKRDAELKGEFDKTWAGLLGGGVGGGMPSAMPSSAPMPVDPASPQGIANDAMKTLGKDQASVIRAGLIQRGLPEHVADGFVMNFQDESGLDPNINEKAPLVPGSRGGFGLAQWTGPRRVALEQFAAQRGAPAGDPNVQMDFLMTELQGPEAGAAQSIMGAKDAGSAAQAIVKDFLRPAKPNLDRRMAEYGGSPVNPMDIGTLAELAGSPYATPGQKAVVQALLGQQMQAMDPGYQLDLQMKQAQIAKAQAGEGKSDLVRQREELAQMGGLVPGSPEYQQFVLTGNTIGRGANEYGLQPIYGTDAQGNIVVSQLGKDGTAITTKLPEGFTPNLGIKKEEEARGTAVGKASGEATADLSGARITADRTLKLVDELANDPYLDSMIGSVQGRLPNLSADAGRVQSRMDQLQGSAFLEAYNMLRGGGQITEVEGKKAEDAMARLKKAQGEEDYRVALQDFRDAVETGIRKLEARSGATAFRPDAAAGGATPNGGSTYTFNPETGELE